MSKIGNLIDRLDEAWQRWLLIPPSRLKRVFWMNALLWLALALFILLVYKPFPDICFIKPAGWFKAPGSLFYFWLPAIWFFIVAVHFFVVSALTVDEDWAVARSREMRAKSVDFSHMNSIMDRQWDGDDSVISPADPRRKSDAFGKPLPGKKPAAGKPVDERTRQRDDKGDD